MCADLVQAISNLCDYPTSSFPVTQVDVEKDVKVAAHDFASPFDKVVYDRCESLQKVDGLY